MSIFVLVAGAWHGAWCWSEIRPLLAKEGHSVLAPDLPGMGEDHRPFSATSFDGWTQFIAGVVAAQREPVILVGHSRGGIVISQAAEIAPAAIRSTVYLAGMLIPNGQRMAWIRERVAFDPAIAAAVTLTPAGDSTILDPALIPSHFYNTTPPELQARAVAMASPEPLFSAAATMQLTADRFGRVPRAYIECLQDRSVKLEAQRLMRHEQPCWHVGALDTDHSPFFSAPADLAAQLLEIADTAPSRR